MNDLCGIDRDCDCRRDCDKNNNSILIFFIVLIVIFCFCGDDLFGGFFGGKRRC
ncbi:hypothetical protein RBU61_09045 [Tissierella sp. MB52-C2]|uniref:hypothetical protein n=1 Tax=Tissierella sp. MB52-C2 TaxID=3070999 RepID=UPI00280C2E5F|nr:hypothetical protein [Tissierella sp. MB52-C2]WMM26811.1 hypothetical protein RBU61_09045 [Tissierella sp. MB52-C2]